MKLWSTKNAARVFGLSRTMFLKTAKDAGVIPRVDFTKSAGKPTYVFTESDMMAIAAIRGGEWSTKASESSRIEY
jgi:hypothetical protein